MSYSAALLGLGVIGVVVGRRFLGFFLSVRYIDCYIGYPLLLGLDLAFAVSLRVRYRQFALFSGLLLLEFRFLPNNGSHRCYQFVRPP